VPREHEKHKGVLERLDDAVGRVAMNALRAMFPRLFGRERAAPEPEQTTPSEESSGPELDPLKILAEQADYPVHPEETDTDTNTVAHRLAAGGRLSPEGAGLCLRLLQENAGYEPNSVLEAAIFEGKFSSEDLARIAEFLVSVCQEPEANTYSNESLARHTFEALAERGVAPTGLVRLCVQTTAEGGCELLTYPMEGYLKKAVKLAPEAAALVRGAFNQENYAAYCRKQPGAEVEPAPPANWNEWEGHPAWSEVGRKWPLAEVFFEVATAADLDRLLAEEPREGIPSHHTLHYFLLQHSWRERRESPGSLGALGKLLRNTAGKPAWKHLHDRAVLVFRDHWIRSPLGSLTAKAAEVYLGLLRLQPAIDPQHPPEPLAGMNRLHLAKLQKPPEPAQAAAREPWLVPSQEALRRRFERLRANVEERPDDSSSWHEIAGIYRELSEWDKAIIAEDLAIEHRPNYALAYYGRGKTWMELHRWAQAGADFTAAIRLWEFPGGLEKFLTLEQPSDEYVDSYRTRGVAQAHTGDYPAGIANVKIAVRLDPNNARLHFELGYLEEKAGRVEEARVDVHNAALLYLDRGDKSGAEECVAALDRLGAVEEADKLRIRMSGRRPSDLPL
jgi:tetratricopeptide (TPR) repeat protein